MSGSTIRHFTNFSDDVPAPYGPYAHAVEAGDFVFVSGQSGRDSVTGGVINGGIGDQTSRALEIIGQILARAGLTFRNVVRTTVYLADVDDFEAMNAVYRTVFDEPFPARSTPQANLPFGALVAIDVIAYRGTRAV